MYNYSYYNYNHHFHHHQQNKLKLHIVTHYQNQTNEPKTKQTLHTIDNTIHTQTPYFLFLCFVTATNFVLTPKNEQPHPKQNYKVHFEKKKHHTNTTARATQTVSLLYNNNDGSCIPYC